ncbi:MAG: hypothetical protein JXR63_01215 [Spirochaetales bacterium]|nr:hypothetical protein [Spirochaetales bacterium]
MKKLSILFMLITLFSCAAEYNIFPRWADSGNPANPHPGARHFLAEDGAITWDIANDNYLPHSNHIEMSGEQISTVVSYGVDAKGRLMMSKHIVWPMLRTIPNNTHASLYSNFDISFSPIIKVNNIIEKNEYPQEIKTKGYLQIKSKSSSGLTIIRTIFPSTDRPVIVEKWEIINSSQDTANLFIEGFDRTRTTSKAHGVDGSYFINSKTSFTEIERTLKKDESLEFFITFSARKENQVIENIDAENEFAKRIGMVDEIFSKLKLTTPDKAINAAFNFAKLRASESIYRTKNGLMHGPGGGSYYAAIWANDQAEYVNPYFAYSGYKTGIESAINSFLMFEKWMKPDFSPVPSSIIAEGIDSWGGAGDRGDAAMIAYGAARFALSYGDRETAEKLWPAIQWSLEFTKRKINSEGVVESDSDELEGRFPTGSANLCTSALAYDAFKSASLLARDLGKPQELIDEYNKIHTDLGIAIEKYFGADMHGFETYKYYKENTVLRAWIAIPLTMGIHNRADGTVDALLSQRLWTKDGLKTAEGGKTFWDRATLYAFRGIFEADKADVIFPKFKEYTYRRTLGDHIPYPVEAYPEGNQKHLSAESGLYARIITEGIFGIRPTGLKSFNIKPSLPSEWENISLENIFMHGKKIDKIDISTQAENYSIEITIGGITNSFIIKKGETKLINL